MAGALKNVYAIAAGMADGLGYENNTRASSVDVTFRGCGLLNTPRLDHTGIGRDDKDRDGVWRLSTDVFGPRWRR